MALGVTGRPRLLRELVSSQLRGGGSGAKDASIPSEPGSETQGDPRGKESEGGCSPEGKSPEDWRGEEQAEPCRAEETRSVWVRGGEGARLSHLLSRGLRCMVVRCMDACRLTAVKDRLRVTVRRRDTCEDVLQISHSVTHITHIECI